MKVRLDEIQRLTRLGVLMMGMVLLLGTNGAAEAMQPEGMRSHHRRADVKRHMETGRGPGEQGREGPLV
jgi:hypothetical protein